MLSRNHYLSKVFSVTLALVLTIATMFPVSTAYAASLTTLSDTMSSQTVSATSSHTMRFLTPSGATSSTDTIVITFPATYDFTGKAISSVSLTHGTTTGLENTETLAAAPSVTSWGAVFSGASNRVLTLTPPTDGIGTHALMPNTRVIITYTSASSTNPTTPGSYTTTISGNFGDVGDLTNVILSSNQVNIDATVSQTMTFTISTTSISFGTLSAVAARFASSTAAGSASEGEAHNIIVGTNASAGYTLTATGTTLTYGTNTIAPIGGANTLSATGTEQFGLRAVASGGSGTVSAPYAAAGFAYATSSFPSAIATSNVASANTTYSMRYLANISSLTEAGIYTAALQYVATANF
jgi:trimeric autotransporter adhesin